MKRLIKFPSIEKLINLFQNFEFSFGDNEKPVLTFSISEKIHGTNAGISYSVPDGIWFQSKENIITSLNDNQGFAFFGENKEKELTEIILILSELHDIDLSKNIITLYGEFAGGNIQKNSALSGCEKHLILFSYAKVSPIEPSDTIKSYWVYTYNLDNKDSKILNINNNLMSLPTITVDFNDYHLANKTINEYVLSIEEHSPLGILMGKTNICEGVVCSYLDDKGGLLIFKVKGEKHANRKSKGNNKKIEDKEINPNVKKCVEDISHDWRYEQALVEIFGNDYEKKLDRRKLADYLQWVSSDVIKEESVLISKYGLEPKDVLPAIKEIAKKYYFNIENS